MSLGVAVKRLSVAAAVIALCVAVPAGPASAVPPPPPPNLIANGTFDQAFLQPGLAPWTCEGATAAVRLDEGVVNDFSLAGTPTAQSTAGCWQVIPVRPSSTYQLSGRFKGGYAVLGSDYGSAANSGSAGWSGLSLSFTTGPDTSLVRVFVRGGYGQPRYYADSLTLNGPESTVVRPVAPVDLVAAEQRSTSVSLRWAGSPGATRYLVYQDGVQIGTTGTLSWTSFYVRNVVPGSTHTYAVAAADAAGSSPLSRPVTSTAPRAYGTPPPPPSPIRVSVTGRTFSLSWDPVPTATDGYAVHFVNSDSNVEVFAPRYVSPIYGPATYTVTVSSWNSAGRGPESAPVTFTVP